MLVTVFVGCVLVEKKIKKYISTQNISTRRLIGCNISTRELPASVHVARLFRDSHTPRKGPRIPEDVCRRGGGTGTGQGRGQGREEAQGREMRQRGFGGRGKGVTCNGVLGVGGRLTCNGVLGSVGRGKGVTRVPRECRPSSWMSWGPGKTEK